AVEKLAAKLPALASGKPDERLGIEVVRYPEKVVRELITERVGKPLTMIEWSEVAPHFMSTLHRMLRNHRTWLEPRSVQDLDPSPDPRRTVASGLAGVGDYVPQLPSTLLRRIQGQFYTAALSVALEHIGYEVRTGPGEPLRFHRGDEVIEPSKVVSEYVSGEL